MICCITIMRLPPFEAAIRPRAGWPPPVLHRSAPDRSLDQVPHLERPNRQDHRDNHCSFRSGRFHDIHPLGLYPRKESPAQCPERIPAGKPRAPAVSIPSPRGFSRSAAPPQANRVASTGRRGCGGWVCPCRPAALPPPNLRNPTTWRNPTRAWPAACGWLVS